MTYSQREMVEVIGPHVSDGVVLLRPMTLHDVEPHLAGEDEPSVRWLSGGVSTRETVTAWIKRSTQGRREYLVRPVPQRSSERLRDAGVLLICEYLRDNTTTDTAMIQVDLDTAVSAKVPVRAGFRFVGKRVTPDRRPLLTFVRRLQ